MREEIKKQKREKERTKEFEANIKHNICIFYLAVVLEWYPLGVKENLDHSQEQVSPVSASTNILE